MDNVRPNKDVATYKNEKGEIWVKVNKTTGESPGGISIFATEGVGKNWWCLDPDTEIPPELELVNDHDDHWLWQPSYTMPLEQYQTALRLVAASFYKVS
jgi:hypothetical protein